MQHAPGAAHAKRRVAILMVAVLLLGLILALAAGEAGLAWFATAEPPSPPSPPVALAPTSIQEVESTTGAESVAVEGKGSQKCRITLKGDVPKDARVVVEVDGITRALPSPPFTLELDEPKPVLVKALQNDSIAFAKMVVCEPGGNVTLEVRVPQSSTAAGARVSKPAASETEAEGSATPSKAAATGRLAINSIPAAAVIVDGRPVGRSPTYVTVSAGRHTVIFVHPRHGRRVVSVTVEPGKSASAVVRF